MLALVAVAASLLWWRLYRAAPAAWLGPAAALILALTVSRGALVAMVVLLIPTLVRFVRHRRLLGLRRPAHARRRLRPRHGARSCSRARGGAADRNQYCSDPDAWRESFNSRRSVRGVGRVRIELAEADRFFGRGLGSGPITHIEEVGSAAEHDEYLRMYLEGGYVGTLLVLAGIGGTLVLVVRAAPKAVRADLLALAAAFAWFSVNRRHAVNATLHRPLRRLARRSGVDHDRTASGSRTTRLLVLLARRLEDRPRCPFRWNHQTGGTSVLGRAECVERLRSASV